MIRNDLFGREVLYTDVEVVDDSNIVDVVNEAFAKHSQNQSQIEYLYNYYKGKQPILYRQKEVRPEINNTIVENRANQIVSFKTGYVYGEPVQFVARDTSDYVSQGISELNEMMINLNMSALNKELADWRNISGTGYKIILSNKNYNGEAFSSPFDVYVLDPRQTFIVYTNNIDKKPLLGVYCTYKKELGQVFSVYSDNRYWEIVNKKITKNEEHFLGAVPIVEYPLNHARLGAFEIVLPQLDMLNNIDSNRMDGMEQTIQAFIKFINCDIDEDDYKKFRQEGAIKVKSTDGQKADVDIVSNELNQDQSQTLKNDVYDSILTICGMPNRNGGSSTSDTGSAVLLRDGWSDAEARAKDDELMFKRSENNLLKIALKIIDMSNNVDKNLKKLTTKDIGMKFTRRNYDNVQSKVQALIQMLSTNKIHPRLAFVHSNLFTDSEDAYQQSMKYYEQEQKRLEEGNLYENGEEIVID